MTWQVNKLWHKNTDMTWAMEGIVYAPNAVKEQSTTEVFHARKRVVLTAAPRNYSEKDLTIISYFNKNRQKNRQKNTKNQHNTIHHQARYMVPFLIVE